MYIYLATGLFAIVALITGNIIYNILLSPLAPIPGLLLAKITSKWLILIDICGNRTSTIHRLHQQYGKTVRIGPSEASFADASVINELYGQSSNFMKAPIYDDLLLHPVGIFSMRVKEDHRRRRKLLSHAFAQSNLLEIEPVIGYTVKQLLRRIEEAVGRPTDTLALLRMFALDVVGELFLGKSFEALKSSTPPTFVQDLDAYFMVQGLKGSFPWIFKIASYFPSKSWYRLQQAPDGLRTYGENALKDYRSRHGSNLNVRSHKDLLIKMLGPSPGAKGEVPMTDDQISMETGNLVFAGTDTTSTTLTYLFWQLAQCDWQNRLRDELARIKFIDGVPTFAAVEGCKILDAVIAESLRLFPAAPASLQRETPAEGRHLSGYFIPGGTIVSMQCYSTQRDGAVFHHPDTFDPARWLQEPEKMTEMKLYQMPFSKGTRACLGKNLAMMELKLTVAAVINQFCITVASSMKHGDMDMMDHFLTLPKCGKCDLVFHPIQNSQISQACDSALEK